MKIDTLYEFLLLASTLNYTETAKNFFVSQPVLSNHIASLEKELGVRLFNRNSHAVELTEVGAIFVADARKIVDDYESCYGSHRSLSRRCYFVRDDRLSSRIVWLVSSRSVS